MNGVRKILYHKKTPYKEFLLQWIPYFKNDKCVIIENLEEIKEISLEEYEILDSQSITSLV